MTERTIRFAMPTIGGTHWLGGWNYMLGLVQDLAQSGPTQFETVILAGTDERHSDLDALGRLPRTTVVYDAGLNAGGRSHRLNRAIFTGLDPVVGRLVDHHAIHAILEPARFYGWRLPIPALAWMPDFQHRILPDLFGRAERWRRELGFRAQVAAGREILLSSLDAEHDCHNFYPKSLGRTHVASFAGPIVDANVRLQASARVAALGVPDRFFFISNQLWRHKNFGVAIQAAAELKRRGHNAMIVATGHGTDPRAPDLRQHFQKQLADGGLNDHFRFLGSIPYADVQALIVAASGLINPSLFEGWNTAIEEAKAVGTPLLLSDIAVHREQADGQASFFPKDDFAVLADLIQSSATRHDDAAVFEAAQERALVRHSKFACAVSAVVTRKVRESRSG